MRFFQLHYLNQLERKPLRENPVDLGTTGQLLGAHLRRVSARDRLLPVLRHILQNRQQRLCNN